MVWFGNVLTEFQQRLEELNIVQCCDTVNGTTSVLRSESVTNKTNT